MQVQFMPDTSFLRSRGRPRGYDQTSAVDAAMRIFWMKGYDQAPVDMLCRSMGMPRHSLYKTFDSKQGLFLAALAHYAETRLRPVWRALGPKGSLDEDLTAFFAQIVQLSAGDPRMRGCLVSSVLLEAATNNAMLQEECNRRLVALESRIAERLVADGWPEEGDCPSQVSASLIAAMARGIVQRARAGQDAAGLRRIGQAAVRAVAGLRG